MTEIRAGNEQTIELIMRQKAVNILSQNRPGRELQGACRHFRVRLIDDLDEGVLQQRDVA